MKPFFSYLFVLVFASAYSQSVHFLNNDSIPPGFPDISTFTSPNTAPGYIYYATTANPYRLAILNQNGIPVYWNEEIIGTYSNFRYQNDNLYTFADQLGGFFVAMDSNYTFIDTFRMAPGLNADFHDIQITPSGNAILINYDPQPVDMSQVVPGGDPNAFVVGLILQEIDPDGNVVFEWQSWDHFEITDGLTIGFNPIDFAASMISYVHCNSIEIDTDGNWIISSRHMSEVTKINRQTGDIIWRMGGLNNEFTFVNDPFNGFTDQHDARRLENGNIMIFDNGLNHTPPTTRVVEYAVDEVNKIATLVWQYANPEGHLTQITGNAQRMENGNTFIAWGRRSNVTPAPNDYAVEVDYDGNTTFELFFNNTGQVGFIYRIFKLPWNGPDLATGISGVSQLDASVQLFPNPASQSIRFLINSRQPGSYELSIIDIAGREVVKEKFSINSSGIQDMTIDVNNWPVGLYFYTLSLSGKSITGRFAVKH